MKDNLLRQNCMNTHTFIHTDLITRICILELFISPEILIQNVGLIYRISKLRNQIMKRKTKQTERSIDETISRNEIYMNRVN